MNILFCCTANKNRSTTAEEWSKEQVPENEYKSCGLSADAVYQTQEQGQTKAQVITEELINWADKIIVFETMHVNSIISNLGQLIELKIINLDIPDIYTYDDIRLKEVFKEKLLPLLTYRKPIETPSHISEVLSKIPFEIQIRSIIRQNKLEGSVEQIENTVRALEWTFQEALKRQQSSPTSTTV